MLTKHVKHWLATMGLLLCSLTTSAYDFEVNGICYNILLDVDLTVEVTESNNGYSGDVVIPSTVVYEGITYQVTSIGEYAFAYCSISSVTIPFGVTSIGGHAFYSCSLTAIDLPEGVTSIGNSAFCGSDLVSITIPNSVTSIEKFTFSVCPNLTTITISGSVKSIDYQAFYLSNLESITCESVIPPTINHSGLSSVDSSIPIYVPALAIEAYKSAECWSEYTNILPIGVVASGTCGDNLTWELTDVGRLVIEGEEEMYDFSSEESAPWDEYKEAIRAISIREGVTSIGNYAFLDCTALESVEIAESVTSIGESAFGYCSSLVFVTIPEGVIEIKGFAFADCVSLRAVDISSTVEFIEERTFLRCDNLSRIQINRGNLVYYSGNNHDYILEKNSKTLVYSIRNDIPEDVEHLGDFAFSCRKNLGHLDIPEGVISYGDYTFLNSSINSIKIPSSLKYCGFATFGGYGYDCELEAVYIDDLTSWFDIEFKEDYGTPLYLAKNLFLNGEKIEILSIPNDVSILKKYALAGWNGKEVVLSSNVAEIKANAFRGCNSLTRITCEAVMPPIVENYAFSGVDRSIPIYVPAGSVDVYKAAEGWSEFANIRPITDEYTLTVSSAGYATMYLDCAVEIPNDVKVYIATSVEGDRLMMTEVEDVLPANTGVIVRAKEGTYTFVESEDAPANVDGNLLSGTATDTYITAESGYRYYVLAQKEGVVGMYRPKLTDGRFLNNANKAYLALESSNLGIFDEETNTEDEGGQLSNRLRFDFGGTTDIEKTIDKRSSLAGGKSNGGQTMVIYDLQGRRVEKPTKPGIYIVNGQKVMVR